MLFVEGAATDYVFLENVRCSLSELGTSFGFDPVVNRDGHFKITFFDNCDPG